MVVLGIDTCSSICGVALVRDELVIGKFIINIPNFHDEKLMGIISDLLKACSLDIDNVDGYAVTIGPGSFTGIRIGMSVAKGLSHSLGKPVAGITSLDSFAVKAHNCDVERNITTICSVIDAKRDEVYYSIYRTQPELERVSDYDCKTIEELIKITPLGTLFIGDGVEKIKAVTGKDDFLFAGADINDNDPAITALLGYKKIISSVGDDVDKMEPLYIKDFKPLTKIKGEI